MFFTCKNCRGSDVIMTCAATERKNGGLDVLSNIYCKDCGFIDHNNAVKFDLSLKPEPA